MSQQRRVRTQFDIEPHVGRRLDDVEKDLILSTLSAVAATGLGLLIF